MPCGVISELIVIVDILFYSRLSYSISLSSSSYLSRIIVLTLSASCLCIIPWRFLIKKIIKITKQPITTAVVIRTIFIGTNAISKLNLYIQD